MSHQDGTVVHQDNARGPPPNYDPYMISSPDHPFFPGAPITKRMFKDMHQAVFAIVILRAWTLVPAILRAEAGRHYKMVALKNNISEARQENPALLALNAEIGTRGPIRLVSLWKKCCFGYLVQANILDPVVFTFSALVVDRITLARQHETRYEWLHFHDSLTGEKRLFRNTLPLGLMAEFLANNYADAIRHEIVNNHSGPRVLNSGPGLVNFRYTLACSIVTLQHAFSADWNWAAIRAFDPSYSPDLADDAETANFFEEMISVASELVANWDFILPQVRETVNLAICYESIHLEQEFLLDTASGAPQSKKDQCKPMQPKFASIKANIWNARTPPPVPTLVLIVEVNANLYASSLTTAKDGGFKGAPNERHTGSRTFNPQVKNSWPNTCDGQETQLEALKQCNAKSLLKAGLDSDSEFKTLEKNIKREHSLTFVFDTVNRAALSLLVPSHLRIRTSPEVIYLPEHL
ncbi:hypothetical protein DEU56DRAFT_920444 [Suillus clintonianus]|uniref:uncharacterized protein n=1 Tax=Suillus clintonianus TaxID=1904413 RepID=UPI001B863EF2|nr:uncharacterized protein DEU56DRAFT_920444 [Suillus clintonianus]KAG2108866.1 hypothetical protein DEU56DRAFT_920444 [Suillus clintonianus]